MNQWIHWRLTASVGNGDCTRFSHVIEAHARATNSLWGIWAIHVAERKLIVGRFDRDGLHQLQKLQKQSTSDWVSEPWTWTMAFSSQPCGTQFWTHHDPPPFSPPYFCFILFNFVLFYLFYVWFSINKFILSYFYSFLFLFYFIFIYMLSHFLLASSPRSSSPLKHTRPLVAVLKSSHSCSFFSFVADHRYSNLRADENLCGRKVLLLTSFPLCELLRYPRENNLVNLMSDSTGHAVIV